MACRGLAQRVFCSLAQCPGRPHQPALPRSTCKHNRQICSNFTSVDCSRALGARKGSCRRLVVTNAAAAAATPARGWKDNAAWLTLLLNAGGTIEPAQAMGFIVSVYAAFLCIGSLVVGRASDYFGPKPVMVVTLFGGGASLLLSSLAQNYNQFVFGRAATGLFGGTVTCAQSYVGGISKNAEVRSSRVSTMQAVTSFGYVCGPGIGGVLHGIGAMAPLVAAGATSMIACLAALITLPHQPPARAPAAAQGGVPKKSADVSNDSVATKDVVDAPSASRDDLVKAALRDPVVQLMLVANFCSAFVNPVFTFFSLIATTTLKWASSREIALFFTLAGACAIPASAAVQYLVKKMGLMRMGIASMMIRGLGIFLMGASVIYVEGSPLCGTSAGVAIVMAMALLTTISQTILMAFKSVAALELVEARGGGAVRGEVLSWLTLIQFSANISAPMVLGWATALSPVDGRFMFLLAVLSSMIASGILLCVMKMESQPVDNTSETSRLNLDSQSDSPKPFRAIQWAPI